MMAIVQAALHHAPELQGNVVVITSAKRPDTGGRSKHPMCGAFDFRCKTIIAPTEIVRIGDARIWAERMQHELGSDYDVIAHGEGDNLHVHAEYDPK
jgi:hypothetical protein